MDGFFNDCCDLFREVHEACKRSVAGLPQQALDWVPGEGMNSLAVLVVHLTGAERYWIGDVALGDPSGRKREEEFLVDGLGEMDLVRRLDDSLDYMQAAAGTLREANLSDVRISPRDGKQFAVGWAILHALEHTATHVGHMQITRQLWDLRAG